MYTKKQFATELQAQLDQGFDINRISTWAHDEIFFKNREFENGLEETVLSLVMMEMGEEFKFSEEELRALVYEMGR